MGSSMADLHPLTIGAVITAAGVTWLQAAREPNVDRRVTFAVLWMVLVSPLGWIYYLPLGVGSMVSTWPKTNIVWLAVAFLCIPFPLIQGWLNSPEAVRATGSVYGIAVLLMWVAWARAERSKRPTHE